MAGFRPAKPTLNGAALSEQKDPIDHSTPAPPVADRRSLFYYLLPTGICAAIIVGSAAVEVLAPSGDSRNFQGPCALIIMLPVALVYLIAVFREARKIGGFRALKWAVTWNGLLAIAPWAVIWIFIKLRLFRP